MTTTMLTPVPNSLKKSIDSMDYSKFTTFSETPSEEIMRLKNQVLRDVKDGLQYIFQTENDTTLCFGACDNEIDAILSNLVDKDDVVLIGRVGDIGHRAAGIAQMYGAHVHTLHAVPGQVLTTMEISAAVEEHKPQILFLAHGDFSTGVLQPISEIGKVCRRNDCILMVDATCSLGAAPLFVDAWNIDVAYTASHRTLCGPAGIMPLTLNARALAKIARRKTPVPTSYWNVTVVANLWNQSGTGSNISLKSMLDMRQVLFLMCYEGLGRCIDRYYEYAKRLQNGLRNTIGLDLFVDQQKHRLPSAVVAKLPHRINDKRFVKFLMDRYSLEVSVDSNFCTNTIVRVLLMPGKANQRNVNLILHAFHEALTLMIPTYVNPSNVPFY